MSTKNAAWDFLLKWKCLSGVIPYQIIKIFESTTPEMADSIPGVIFMSWISKNWIRDWNCFDHTSMQILLKNVTMFLELQYISNL